MICITANDHNQSFKRFLNTTEYLDWVEADCEKAIELKDNKSLTIDAALNDYEYLLRDINQTIRRIGL